MNILAHKCDECVCVCVWPLLRSSLVPPLARWLFVQPVWSSPCHSASWSSLLERSLLQLLALSLTSAAWLHTNWTVTTLIWASVFSLQSWWFIRWWFWMWKCLTARLQRCSCPDGFKLTDESAGVSEGTDLRVGQTREQRNERREEIIIIQQTVPTATN